MTLLKSKQEMTPRQISKRFGAFITNIIWCGRYCSELWIYDCIVLSGQASCTLEAGVKIYSVRVDSVHAEAYKVLGRINRAGLEDDQGICLYSLV